MTAIDRPDLRDSADLVSNEGRVKRVDEIDQAISAWTRAFTVNEALDILSRAGVPASRIYTVKDIAADPQYEALRVLTIFDGLIFTLFEVRFPFRFPHAVGEDGKRNWEADIRCRAGRCVEHREVRAGWRADSPRDRVRSDPRRSMR
jgi:crotonobetainyl-CoA:carnitine CoA-transferase CaiB-like acyl-CoA transferase